MKKILLLLILFLFFGSYKVKAITYNSYKVGDIVTYNDIEFYVIGNSDSETETVTLLKKTPLTMTEVNKYGTGHVNVNTNNADGLAYDINGYGGVAFYSSDSDCGYYIKTDEGREVREDIYNGCVELYDSSDIKYIVDSWANANIKDEDTMYYEYGYAYRLLKYEDLIYSLGYETAENGLPVKTSASPDWISNTSYSYWISDNSTKRAVMKTDGSISAYNFSSSDVADNPNMFEMNVIRPVVIISKKALDPGSNTNVKSLNSSSFNVGDIVEYNGIKYYVLRNVDSSVPTLTLLKYTPLTVSEVNSYGKNIINKYTSESRNTAFDNNGYGGMAYYSREKCRKDNKSECSTSYKTSDIKHVVDSWAEEHTNSSDLYVDSSGYAARILNSTDLAALGYELYGNSFNSFHSSLNTPYFLTNFYNCWTTLPFGDNITKVLKIYRNGNSVSANIYDYENVVCPVITIKRPGYLMLDIPNTKKNKAMILIVVGIFLIIGTIFIGIFLKIKSKRTKK